MTFAQHVTIWYTRCVQLDFPPPVFVLLSVQVFPEPRYLLQLIVQTYRIQLGSGDKPLSFAHFAKTLRQTDPQLNLRVSSQTIRNWESGIHCPNFFFILKLAEHAPEGTWQRAFAMDLLAVQWPMVYQPGSEIGAKYVKALLDS